MCVLVSRWASPTVTNVTVTLALQILYDAIHLLLHPEVCILELFYSALQLVVCILELFYSTLELLSILSWGRWGRSPKRWGRPHAKSFYIARSRLKNHHRYLIFGQRLCFRSATMLILYSQHLLLSFQIIETIRNIYILVLQTYIE